MLSSARLVRAIVLPLAAFASLAVAQEPFPSRPVRLIVPVAAGGGIDTAFRALAPAWSDLLGQQVVVENRPGGGQVLGSDHVAKSKPDGYTLFMTTNTTHSANPSLYKQLRYDPIKDFTPLSIVVTQPLLVVVHPNVPVKSMPELVAYAKAQPQPLQYTTGGIGSYGHLWWEMVRSQHNLPGQHIAYNGIAPALKDVMGGQVPLLIDAIVPSGAQVQAGTVRGIAIVASKRATSLPNLPTLAEQGYAGLDAAPFYGILGPAGMDAAVVQKLHATLAQALAQPAVRDKLGSLGFDIVASTPDAYAKLIRDEIERWSKVVKEQNIKVD